MPETATLLADLLRAEAAVFIEMAGLAAEQRRALLAADPERLEAVVRRAEGATTRFRLLEDERRRVEDGLAPDAAGDPGLHDAREAVLVALGRLLHETSVSGSVLEKLGDSALARQAAVGGLFNTTYMPDGRAAACGATGMRLSAEG